MKETSAYMFKMQAIDISTLGTWGSKKHRGWWQDQQSLQTTWELREASLVAQTVKNPPAIQETWVRFLDLEDPLEEGMATHSSVLACKIPWTEEPGRLQSMGSQRVRHD